jgi:predicted mannosyl-3-phosphoglycerate phosphatase (HAD superfamily)
MDGASPPAGVTASDATTPPLAAVSLVVFSATDHLWPAIRHNTAGAVRAAQWLVSRSVPLVIFSRRSPGEVLALQCDLKCRHPFVADGWSSLYIPAGYFPEPTRIGVERDGWNIIEFAHAPASGHAVRLLGSLYRLSGEDVVVVGLCDAWEDRALLSEADVQVVVRSGAPDEARLLQAFPLAYLTNASGAAGWSEAILGSAAE